MTTTANPKPPIEKVDRASALVFDWGSIQWLVSDTLFQGCELTLGHVEIEPGQRNILHLHPNCDEALYLIEGELLHSIGEEQFKMLPGTTIFIPRNAPHNAVNLGDTVARMVVAYSSGDRQTTVLEEGDEG